MLRPGSSFFNSLSTGTDVPGAAVSGLTGTVPGDCSVPRGDVPGVFRTGLVGLSIPAGLSRLSVRFSFPAYTGWVMPGVLTGPRGEEPVLPVIRGP